MKFKIIISKQANLFFFISNLTEWHFSCRLAYNEEWIKMTGALKSDEKKILKKIKIILKKYGFKTYLGKFFINSGGSKNNWNKLEKLLKPREYKDLKASFEIFSARFRGLWLNNLEILKRNKKIINDELKKKRISQIIKNLHNFFDYQKSRLKILEIFLIASPVPFSNNGGANLKNNQITAECHKIEPETSYSERIIRLIFHEYSHLLLKSSEYIPILSKNYDGEQLKLGEAVICSLLPNGYLAEKYFHYKVSKKFKTKQFKNKPKNKQEISSFSAFKGYNIAKQYIEKDKKLDKGYINRIKSLIKK